MAGWISIHRKIQGHWLWAEKPYSKGQAWIDLLLSANHEDCKFLLGNQLIEVKRGDVVTSEVKLMDKWGWSKTKVRSFLVLLERDSMIVKKTDHKKTTLSLVNYGVWQDYQTAKEPEKNRKETSEEPLPNHLETSEEPLPDTINNSNNSNNSNKEYILVDFESLWKLYPKKEGKGQVSKTQKEKLHKIGIEEMTRAINRYVNAKSGTDRKYLQNGSTFFNSGYVDYLDANYQDQGGENGGIGGKTKPNTLNQGDSRPWENDPYLKGIFGGRNKEET